MVDWDSLKADFELKRKESIGAPVTPIVVEPVEATPQYTTPPPPSPDVMLDWSAIKQVIFLSLSCPGLGRGRGVNRSVEIS